MFIFIKQCIIKALLFTSRGLKCHASILMYHTIDNRAHFLAVRPEAFERQLRFFKEHNIRVVRLFEIVSRLYRGESVASMVALTFDDGYENFYTNAWPLLKKYQLPVTMFLPTGLLGKTYATSDGTVWPIMTEAMVKEIAADGLVEFMSHTQTHADLSKLAPKFYDSEIEASRTVLRCLPSRANTSIFAYPKGRFTPAVVEYLKEKKWEAAVGVKGGLVSASSDIYDLFRNGVGPETSSAHFELLISDRLSIFLRLKHIFLR